MHSQTINRRFENKLIIGKEDQSKTVSIILVLICHEHHVILRACDNILLPADLIFDLKKS
jgi:hypothetical protein